MNHSKVTTKENIVYEFQRKKTQKRKERSPKTETA